MSSVLICSSLQNGWYILGCSSFPGLMTKLHVSAEESVPGFARLFTPTAGMFCRPVSSWICTSVHTEGRDALLSSQFLDLHVCSHRGQGCSVVQSVPGFARLFTPRAGMFCCPVSSWICTSVPGFARLFTPRAGMFCRPVSSWICTSVYTEDRDVLVTSLSLDLHVCSHRGQGCSGDESVPGFARLFTPRAGMFW